MCAVCAGGGKTTLLSILGGRATKNTKTDGTVLFNGAPLNKRAKRQTGFVMQASLGWWGSG
jgi:ABC-type multidrug transport system ATPase subunit